MLSQSETELKISVLTTPETLAPRFPTHVVATIDGGCCINSAGKAICKQTNGSGGKNMNLLNRWERWDPFAELNSLQRQMDHLFRDTFNFNETFPFDGSGKGGAFVPSADVYETPENLQLRLEIAGVKDKDLNIKIENGILTVRVERTLKEGEKEQKLPSHGTTIRRVLSHAASDSGLRTH
jgi:HSP20 family molecular chaperone IbpA